MEKRKTIKTPARTIPEHTVPEQTQEVYEGTYCDICKERIVISGFSADETEIRMKKGRSYPEGGSGTETTFDICVECFEEKLIPFFKDFGGEPSVRNWDW